MSALNYGTVIPAGFTGTKLFRVSPARRVSIGVVNPGAGTFRVVAFLNSEHDFADRAEYNLTDNLTATQFVDCAVGGLKEVGIRVVVASGSTIKLEVVECAT